MKFQQMTLLLSTIVCINFSNNAHSTTNNNPQPIPDGDKYNLDVMNATSLFNRQQKDTAFETASRVIVPTTPRAASVCVTKEGETLVRSHSSNVNARGVITSALDIDAFKKIFQAKLSRGSALVLNVPKDLNGDLSQGMNTYIGVVFLQNGDGSTTGDYFCFARYQVS